VYDTDSFCPDHTQTLFLLGCVPSYYGDRFGQQASEMKQFGGDYWTIGLPDEWIGERDSEGVTLYDPNGSGSLQLSSLKEDTPITAADLKELAAEHIDAGAKPENVELGDFNGFTLSYGFKGEYWREWYLKCGTVMLFVTYTCDLDDEGKEDDLVDLVLETLRAKDEPAH
jgi:hypothetical protein